MYKEIENVLKSYILLKNKVAAIEREKSLMTDTTKGISYDGIVAGRCSSKFINGNVELERMIIKKEELTSKIDKLNAFVEAIYNTVKELELERNGDELFSIIDLRYFKNLKFEEIQEKIKNIEISTIYRRRKEALEILKNKHFGHSISDLTFMIAN